MKIYLNYVIAPLRMAIRLSTFLFAVDRSCSARYKQEVFRALWQDKHRLDRHNPAMSAGDVKYKARNRLHLRPHVPAGLVSPAR
jgi:hypothetical protein